ncbi:glycosyl hydrolase [Rhizocola hellebori]|uniref:Glycosyl hydrolase n=1 Tax=Rhizocola hellebori TaxID=1392758 RepID=A0A8J3Q2B5_9ACTN|nr:glycoside hydrolase family 3 C-terminal domain-containing protein [Rhizocola hellebori]GIH02179.1 glycosyl hydrolase [Rhizocola hellebori]
MTQDDATANLTLEQKIRLLSGASVFRAAAEPAIGLQALVFSDGPVGVRGERWDERDTALTLPSATAMAATWDEHLVTQLGNLLAFEARRKGVHVLLAPTLNLHRSPASGRHFECFAEDPRLTAFIGAAYIRGVQSGGVAATAKHYVANDSETERLTLDAWVDERTLREVYLAPFEAAVQAGVWVVMSAYNSVNGTTMSASPLLAEPLKGEWGFDGLVVSDWGAVRSTVASARAGQDLAMPGPNPFWDQPLVDAVRSGEVAESVIDEKVQRLLRLATRVGALGQSPPSQAVSRPAQARALLRQAVAVSTVLVQNEENFLPLNASALKTVAVIGPNAATARIQGGGSAGVFPESVVTPLEGIRRALAGLAEVGHAAGAQLTVRPTPLDPGCCTDPVSGEPGVRVRYLDSDGAQLHTERRLSGRILEPADAPLPPDTEFVEVDSVLRPACGGQWLIGIVGIGDVVVHADGKPVLEENIAQESDDPTYVHVAPSFRQVPVTLTEGVPVHLTARRRIAPGTGLAVALTADPPRLSEDDELAAAVRLARASDIAIVVVGTTDEIESEGFDRSTLDLPGRQDELVTAVAAANPNTVVIVNSGGPVLLPWRDRVRSVLLSWFPGQEAGDGLADVLFGAAEPGGRLPTTWPISARDVPVLDTKPIGGALDYTEGLHLGYRAWLSSQAEPMYWFGYGQGYTEWEYQHISMPEQVSPDAPFTVEVQVSNTGQRRGREVVQVYLSRDDSTIDRPARWLAGHAVIEAEPAQTVAATVTIPARALQHWSTAQARWCVEPGTFRVHAGSSVAALPLAADITVATPDSGREALVPPH